MKKVMLIGLMICIGLQTFAFSLHTYSSPNPYKLPASLNGMPVQNFLAFTPKKYFELTGKRMSLKQKIGFAIIKAKLKRQLPDDKTAPHKTDLGLLSLIFGAAAFIFVLINSSVTILLSIPLAIAAVILGILGLGKKKGDTKSIIGLVFGATFILLVAIALASIQI